ncbi:Cysteine synthase [Mycena kentingensis (nom. inval.)]|nr:Cysteine synthase [Mycena kentingensis (nom. inval.)]
MCSKVASNPPPFTQKCPPTRTSTYSPERTPSATFTTQTKVPWSHWSRSPTASILTAKARPFSSTSTNKPPSDGVRIYAKLMSHVPATNVKSYPALNMILRGQEQGQITPDTHTLVEYSSGSTVISMGLLAPIYGIRNVHAYISNKTTTTKLNLLRFFGLDLTLFGGHSQPEPQDPNGGIRMANEVGAQDGFFNPNQHSNPENYKAHMRWTGPQIMKQLPGISVFSASIGTSGTMTGTGLYLKKAKPSIARVGVCTSPGERVPGPRMYSLLAPVTFPWRDAVDCVEEIGPFDSYEKSLSLSRAGLLVGPSSGMALAGLFRFLDKKIAAGELDSLRNEDGEIPCVFIAADQPFQYVADYFQKLPPSYFHPIRNEELIGVDHYVYNVGWEITPETAHQAIIDYLHAPDKSKLVVLDLRDTDDFAAAHIPDISLSLPLGIRDAANPYKHPPTMVEQFRFLDKRLGADDLEFGNCVLRPGQVVLTLSYKGHVGRLAMSILRSRGVLAECVTGGVDAWSSVDAESGGLWKRSCGLRAGVNGFVKRN